MRTAFFIRLVAKDDPHFTVSFDPVFSDNIVSVPMTDRNAELEVVEDPILFDHTMLNTPTEKEPDSVTF